MNVDLGSGPVPQEGFVGLDVWPGGTKWEDLEMVDVLDAEGHVTGRREPRGDQVALVDLQQFPWPMADNSVERAWCSHYVEYQPRELWTPFVDELYRVLRPDGLAVICWFNSKSGRADQDPLARDVIPFERWSYADRVWRERHCDTPWLAYPTCHLIVTDYRWSGLHDRFVHRDRLAMDSIVAHAWDVAADCLITLQALKGTGPCQHRRWSEFLEYRECGECGQREYAEGHDAVEGRT